MPGKTCATGPCWGRLRYTWGGGTAAATPSPGRCVFHTNDHTSVRPRASPSQNRMVGPALRAGCGSGHCRTGTRTARYSSHGSSAAGKPLRSRMPAVSVCIYRDLQQTACTLLIHPFSRVRAATRGIQALTADAVPVAFHFMNAIALPTSGLVLTCTWKGFGRKKPAETRRGRSLSNISGIVRARGIAGAARCLRTALPEALNPCASSEGGEGVGRPPFISRDQGSSIGPIHPATSKH